MWTILRKSLMPMVTFCGLMWSIPTTSVAGDTVAEVLQATAAARALRMSTDAPVIPMDAYARAEAGEWVSGAVSVEGESAKKAWGVAVLDVPLQRLWAAVVDESGQADFLPTSYIERVRGGACESGRLVFQYLPVNVPLTSDRWWVVQRDHNEAMHEASGGRMRELAYHTVDPSVTRGHAGLASWMEEGVQLEVARGSWLLTSIGHERTLVEYYAWSKPGGKMSPALVSMFTGTSISKTFEGMLAWSKSKELGCL